MLPETLFLQDVNVLAPDDLLQWKRTDDVISGLFAGWTQFSLPGKPAKTNRLLHTNCD